MKRNFYYKKQIMNECYITDIEYTHPLKTGSSVSFHLSNGSIYKGLIVYSAISCRYYISMMSGKTWQFFLELGIENAMEFIEDVAGYKCFGGWPEVKSLEDLEKVIKTLVYVNKPTGVKTTIKPQSEKDIISISKHKSIKFNFKL